MNKNTYSESHHLAELQNCKGL